ncbi:EamA family transporter [Microvirga alba]|uniref:EamA family transporter n=1 Tax=Microvirga alba TaxID=2791025 RepID=A0A931FU42_9HYPH|nr:EamA family transporter [Microvirga alba]MBF9235266.1 EamA family transporter [Microvirga alba]
MKRTHFLIGFLALLALDTLGQIGFKITGENVAPIQIGLDFASRLLSEPWALTIALAYGGAFIVYMTLIRDAPVGLLFAASHLEIVTVTAASMVLFGDRLNLIQLFGCAAILGGVLLLAKTETDATHI